MSSTLWAWVGVPQKNSSAPATPPSDFSPPNMVSAATWHIVWSAPFRSRGSVGAKLPALYDWAQKPPPQYFCRVLRMLFLSHETSISSSSGPQQSIPCIRA